MIPPTDIPDFEEQSEAYEAMAGSLMAEVASFRVLRHSALSAGSFSIISTIRKWKVYDHDTHVLLTYYEAAAGGFWLIHVRGGACDVNGSAVNYYTRHARATVMGGCVDVGLKGHTFEFQGYGSTCSGHEVTACVTPRRGDLETLVGCGVEIGVANGRRCYSSSMSITVLDEMSEFSRHRYGLA